MDKEKLSKPMNIILSDLLQKIISKKKKYEKCLRICSSHITVHFSIVRKKNQIEGGKNSRGTYLSSAERDK